MTAVFTTELAITDSVYVGLDHWLEDFISKPDDGLKRTGAVCPFVPPSRKADSLKLLTYAWSPDDGIARISDIIEYGMDAFRSEPWPASNPNLHSLIIAVPALPEQDWGLIDEGHKLAKAAAVERGIMLGKAHPHGDVPAARNKDFIINRSPYPLYIFRNMAIHDILFLWENTFWFSHYRKRFSERFTNPGGLDPIFVELYEKACALA